MIARALGLQHGLTIMKLALNTTFMINDFFRRKHDRQAPFLLARQPTLFNCYAPSDREITGLALCAECNPGPK
jgi:hypothetical protein